MTDIAVQIPETRVAAQGGHTVGIVRTLLDGDYQPLDADLTAISGLSTHSYGRGVLEQSSASALRMYAGLGSLATQNANAVAITGGSATGLSALGLLGATDATIVATAHVSGDTFHRATIAASGMVGWGPGSGATDVFLERHLAGRIRVLGRATIDPDGSSHTLSDSAMISLFGAASASVDIVGAGWSGAGLSLFGRRAGGSRSAPTGLLSGQAMAALAGGGHDGTAYTPGSTVRILLSSTTAWTTSSWESEIRFESTPSGSTTREEWARFRGRALLIGAFAQLGGERLRVAGGTIATAGATDVCVGGGSVDYGDLVRRRGVQILSSRRTGWTAATGAATRTSFDTSTVSLSGLAERVKALLDDLIAHGLIGD